MAKSLRRKLRQIDRVGFRSAEERARQILDDRTERLAARLDNQAQDAAERRVLVCGAGRERFGIPIEAVAEVLPEHPCIPVPDGPPALVGVFGRNGRIVSVIDLAAALGMETVAPVEGESWRFVLLRQERPQMALRINRAYAVSDAEPLTGEQSGGARNEAVVGHAKVPSGIAGQDAILSRLDTDRLLRPFLPSFPVSGV
jgi:purine-binding chemotaxis protein CheW